METIWNEARLALRSLRHSATFTVAVIATLGIGIGMATAMYTVYKTVLVDRFPIVEQDRVVVMHPLDRRGMNLDVPYRYLEEIARDSALFRGVAGIYHVGVNTTPFLYGGAAIHLGVVHASPNFFDLFGVRPAAGHWFRPEDGEPGAPPVVVLSYNAWQRLGGDPSIVGQTVGLPVNTSIPQQRAEIVGVAPPGFEYPTGTDAWLPLPRGIQIQVDIVARLAPHVTIDAARAGLFALTQRLRPFTPENTGMAQADDPKAFEIARVGAQSFADTIVGHSRPVIIALTLAITLLLVIACINIGNLMLVRLLGRSRDIAVRHALGARRDQIARLFATEATILVTGGGTIGLLLALGALRLLHVAAPVQIPHIEALDALSTPLGTAAALTVCAWLLFAVGLSIGASRIGSYATLRADSRSGADSRPRQRARHVLVATQIALTLVMLTGAGLLVRTLARLQSMDLGYQPEHLSILSFTSFTGSQGGITNPAQVFETTKDLVARMEATPGVVAATPIENDPFKGQGFFEMALVAADRPTPPGEHVPFVPFEFVGSDYFRTFEIPIHRGRGFQASDTKGSLPVVVISETLARQLLPNQDPIGKQVKPLDDTIAYTVVGVASDTRFRELKNVGPVVYFDWTQIPPAMAGWLIAVRTTSPLAAMRPALSAAMHDVDPKLMIWNAQTMDDLLGTPLAQPRLSALLMTSFSLVALLLSTIGLYGVISSAARQKTHDIGVRIALGAQSLDVHRLVLGDAIAVLGAGAAIGIVVALNVGHALSSQLFGVGPIDPISLAAATTVLLAVGLGAAYLPARRASRIDPVEVLRSE
jgi:putative ABC transport system permease protein